MHKCTLTIFLLYYAGILGSIIHCIPDNAIEIANAAKTANSGLMNLVKSTTVPFELQEIIQILTTELLSEYQTTRIACLHWIYMLHEKDPVEMNKYITDLLPALLKTVSDTSDEVVLMNLQVLARISLDEIQFHRVLNSLVQLFLEYRPLLETRGALVIRKLCSLLDSSRIYMTLANILNDKKDLEFVSLMVQTLNLILLTAPELVPLRRSLKQSFQSTATDHDHTIFNSLFICWTHNAVATFSLCLLAQAYKLSSALIFKFAEVDVTVGFLMQIDKLVQLIESPVFIQLRLHLLETSSSSHADLLKSLYGLLMLLPQSQAYKTLSERLTTVSSLHMHIGLTINNSINNGNVGSVGGNNRSVTGINSSNSSSKNSLEILNSNNTRRNSSSSADEHDMLLTQFEKTQERHSDLRLTISTQNNLNLTLNNSTSVVTINSSENRSSPKFV